MTRLFGQPRLMTWQAYQVHRFRRSRNQLWGDDPRRSSFPGVPGLISVVQGAVQEQFANLGGEFLAFPGLGQEIDPSLIDRMVDVLARDPRCDIVHTVASGGCDPLESTFLVRNRVAWMLGGYSEVSAREEHLAYWQQASLLFRSRDLHPDNVEGVSATDLALALQAYSSPDEQVTFDFCRDFYLSPWVCFLVTDCAHGLEPRASRWLDRLKTAIVKSGNIVYAELELGNSGDQRLEAIREYPGQGVATVVLMVTQDAENARLPATGFPQGALKVLVNFPTGPLPETLSQEWDFCLALGDPAAIPLALHKPWQGWVRVQDESGLLDVLDIRVHAHELKRFRRFRSSPEPASCKMSVVVSTYRRKQALQETLASLEKQSFPSQDYEVIVVDNDPAYLFGGSPGVDLGSIVPNMRLLVCPLRGLSFARNAGAWKARGEVICFLDDDALAQETWLEQIWAAFSAHPHAGAIGGHIRLKPPQPQPRILKPGYERFWGQFLTTNEQYTEVDHWMEYPWGGNWCVRREAFLALGGFRGLYGRRGKGFGGGEEIVAASLLQKLGYKVALLPTAEVLHNPDASRYTWAYLRKTIVAQILVNYWMKRDLYLPKTISVSSNFRGAGRFASRLLGLLHVPGEQRSARALEYGCYILAWSRLFFVQLRDYLARFWYA